MINFQKDLSRVSIWFDNSLKAINSWGSNLSNQIQDYNKKILNSMNYLVKINSWKKGLAATLTLQMKGSGQIRLKAENQLIYEIKT